MGAKQEEERCFFCEELFEKKLERGHIIPTSRGGCDCEPNVVPVCEDCNHGEGGQFELTLLEWWAKKQWENDFKNKQGETSVSIFDVDGWTLEERQHQLTQLAYWEARARWHIMNKHKDWKLPNWGIVKEE